MENGACWTTMYDASVEFHTQRCCFFHAGNDPVGSSGRSLKEPFQNNLLKLKKIDTNCILSTCGGATAGGVLYSLDPLERLPVPMARVIGGVGGLLVGAGGTGLCPLKVPVIIGPP